LYKKRGIGMFVATGAKARLMEKRKESFYEQYVVAMIREAEKLGISKEQLTDMIRRGEGTKGRTLLKSKG